MTKEINLENPTEEEELTEEDLEGEAGEFNHELKEEIPYMIKMAMDGRWKQVGESLKKLETYMEFKDEPTFKKKVRVWNYQKRQIKELEDLIDVAVEDQSKGIKDIKDRFEKLDKAFHL